MRPFLAFSKIASIMPCKGDRKKFTLPFGKSAGCPWRAGEKKFSQMADDEYGGRFPVHVRCLLDEFANIGQIPKFEKLIVTIRSREISASIILQSQSQLKAIYKDNADAIAGNCDTTLFLGGKEKTMLKEISELLGKETIVQFQHFRNKGAGAFSWAELSEIGKAAYDGR